jgi:hypothetical protein
VPQELCSPWATADDVMDCSTCFDGRSDYQIADALADSSYLLWAWTGYRWSGLCDFTVWPQVQWGTTSNLPRWTWRGTPGLQDWWYGGWNNSGGLWGEAWCGCNRVGSPLVRRGTQCGCEGVSQIRLGVGTIDSITEVLIDGDVIDGGPGYGYEVRDGSWLVRLPDEGSTDRNYWPSRNRLDLTEDDDHTFVVSFVGGSEPPDMGKRAAISLACELVKQRCGESCSLPSNTTSFTREGIDVQIQSPLLTEDIIKTLPIEVQAFINAVSPFGVRMAPRIFSPDVVESYSSVSWSAP